MKHVIEALEEELDTIDARRAKVVQALEAMRELVPPNANHAPRKQAKKKGSKKVAAPAAKSKSTRGRAVADDVKAQARQRWENGEMVTKIIRETGIGGSTLYAYAKAEGWRRPAKAAA